MEKESKGSMLKKLRVKSGAKAGAVSRAVGVPQAYIPKIGGGKVDLSLSTVNNGLQV